MSDTTVRTREEVAEAARRTITPPSPWRQVRTHVWRNVKRIRRMPEMLADVTFQPIMFVVLFAYVFGGSINAGVNDREWLLPGVMAQTMAFSCFIVAIGLTSDLNKGVIDRFRSLPISRASVPIGRSISSLIHSSIGIVVMAATGLLIGWRIRGSLGEAVLVFGLLLLFGFAMIWTALVLAPLSIRAFNRRTAPTEPRREDRPSASEGGPEHRFGSVGRTAPTEPRREDRPPKSSAHSRPSSRGRIMSTRSGGGS